MALTDTISSMTPAQFKEYQRMKASQVTLIRRLGFSGGGPRGATLAGVYRSLLDTKVLDGVEEVAGTSAGALMATFVALGVPFKKFRKILIDYPLRQLLGEKNKAVSQGAIKPISRDGAPILDVLRTTIRDHLKEELDQLATLAESKLSGTDLEEFKTLERKISTESVLQVSFKDLSLLRKIDSKFKDLSVTAVHYGQSGKLKVFNDINTPTNELAEACRASMSVPLLFTPHSILVDGEACLFIDGGVYMNVPDTFKNNTELDETLLFAFTNGDEFGPGPDDDRLGHAIHHGHWQEMVGDDELKTIYASIFNSIEKSTYQPSKLLKESVVKALMIGYKRGEKDELNDIGEKLMPIILESIYATAQKKFLDKDRTSKINRLIAETKKRLIESKKNIFKFGFFEKVILNNFTRTIGFAPDYRVSDRYRENFIRIHDKYPMRTVNIHAGEVTLTSFDLSRNHIRVMDASGYADTISYLINYGVVNNDCISPFSSYCEDIYGLFVHIYRGVLRGSNQFSLTHKFLEDPAIPPKKDPESDQQKKTKTTSEIEKEEEKEKDARKERFMNYFQSLKEYAVKHPTSAEAFAFTRAIEYKSGLIQLPQLFEETYLQSFKESGWFSRSQATGDTFYRYTSLKESLQKMSAETKKTIFVLDVADTEPEHKTRIKAVREEMKALSNLPIVPIETPQQSPISSSPASPT